jgi:hypothetical protein
MRMVDNLAKLYGGLFTAVRSQIRRPPHIHRIQRPEETLQVRRGVPGS